VVHGGVYSNILVIMELRAKINYDEAILLSAATERRVKRWILWGNLIAATIILIGLFLNFWFIKKSIALYEYTETESRR